MALLGKVTTPVLEIRGQTGNVALPSGRASGGRAGLVLTTGRTVSSELGATLPESPATQAQLCEGPGAQRREAVMEATFPGLCPRSSLQSRSVSCCRGPPTSVESLPLSILDGRGGRGAGERNHRPTWMLREHS